MAEGNVSNDFSLKLCEPHLAGNVVIVVDEEQYEHEQTRIACSEIYLQCVQLEVNTVSQLNVKIKVSVGHSEVRHMRTCRDRRGHRAILGERLVGGCQGESRWRDKFKTHDNLAV